MATAVFSGTNIPIPAGTHYTPINGIQVAAGRITITVSSGTTATTAIIEVFPQLFDGTAWNDYGGGFSFKGGPYLDKHGQPTTAPRVDGFDWPGGLSRLKVAANQFCMLDAASIIEG